MFEYQHEIETNASVKQVWSCYIHPTDWPLWDPSLTAVEFDGPLENGATGLMKLHGMPPLSFLVEALEENKCFTIVAQMGEFKASIAHELVAQNGSTRILHSIRVQGPDEQTVQGIGAGMSGGVPAGMQALAQLCEKV